ncbi:hypothetical protein LCGC14_1851620, partial [marine sediment metagenome]
MVEYLICPNHNDQILFPYVGDVV